MAMKKQPDGTRRVPRGARAVDTTTGKKLPADQYMIYLGEQEIGWTERGPGGRGWSAHTPPFSGPDEHGSDSDPFADHTAAVEWLVEQAQQAAKPATEGVPEPVGEPPPSSAPEPEGEPGGRGAPSAQGDPEDGGAPDDEDDLDEPAEFEHLKSVQKLDAEAQEYPEPVLPEAPSEEGEPGNAGVPEVQGESTRTGVPASMDDPFATDPFGGPDPFTDPFA